MPYKLYWEHKRDKTRTGIGPIIGYVQNSIFVPDNKEMAHKRLEHIESFTKKGIYYLLEVPFTPDDLPELRKIHPTFFSQVDCTQED